MITGYYKMNEDKIEDDIKNGKIKEIVKEKIKQREENKKSKMK